MHELSLRTRQNHLEDMARTPLDVLVVGGGVTGAAILLDAVTRGLRAGLVERDDFACGTSSKSSKMIHGGLRYLAGGDVGLVREALTERRSLQKRAAHLVRPLPMLLPIYGRKIPFQRLKFGTGLWMYDLLGAWRAGVRHSWYGVDKVSRLAPNLDPRGLVGALAYQDDQADDARLVTCILRTATGLGGLVANGATVEHLNRVSGRVTGAQVHLAEGDVLEIDAKVTINAGGVWADTVHTSSGFDLDMAVVPAKGIHITVPRSVVASDVGVGFYPKVGSNLFFEPWQDDLAIVGTTDTAYEGDLANPQATPGDVSGVLRELAKLLRHPIRESDVLSTWAGLRPLVQPKGASGLGDGRTQDLSRADRVEVEPGLVTMLGGKLTTHRAMAEKAIDHALKQLRDERPCVTHNVLLEGADLPPTTANVDALVHDSGLERSTCRHLLRRYGSRARRVLDLANGEPALLLRLHPDRPYLAVEALYAARYEMARTPADIVFRRTRIGIETRDSGDAALPEVERLLMRESAAT
jgi:glycerol-3-phosphate dehydrogenase